MYILMLLTKEKYIFNMWKVDDKIADSASSWR